MQTHHKAIMPTFAVSHNSTRSVPIISPTLFVPQLLNSPRSYPSTTPILAVSQDSPRSFPSILPSTAPTLLASQLQDSPRSVTRITYSHLVPANSGQHTQLYALSDPLLKYPGHQIINAGGNPAHFIQTVSTTHQIRTINPTTAHQQQLATKKAAPKPVWKLSEEEIARIRDEFETQVQSTPTADIASS
jgi:hypothetical protein